ncbi:MAG: alpha/beta hydrolase [Actinophytocola sp.]|uniref:alpha/beta hydrolase family protein n=1 Tax=Actinophytocola sp. TaxID=1872138 RepID=UPI00132BF523|nr:alpha/beta hydrolase [Actinophytocola sp.]MPZ83626.1 alpha/beta hydrolase [Actinophytocola sp.]
MRHSPTPRNRMPRRGLAAVTGLLTLAVSVCAGPTASAHAADPSAGPSTALYLPRPTGTHPVGTTSLYLKDISRPDPWVPEATARELMVSLWYPARPRGERRAQYMTPEESKLYLEREGLTDLPPDLLSTTRTNAFGDAKPVGRRHSLPLVVLSPGFIQNRATLTALAEDLASHGYVVAGIEHTYESAAASFPDGRVATCVACEVDHLPGFWDKLGATRAADVSFVLDELTGAHPKWRGARLIDPSRIAMAGHSAGGASAILAMLADPRVRAGIDMDGQIHVPIPDSGLSRPFMFLGQAVHGPGGPENSWEQNWQHLTGWKRWLVVTGTVHSSFTDLAVLAEQVGIDLGDDLPATRALQITRGYTRAFFDLHLRHRPQPLLDRPSTRYPEVKFCTVETTTCA